jgi:hypothetical protein
MKHVLTPEFQPFDDSVFSIELQNHLGDLIFTISKEDLRNKNIEDSKDIRLNKKELHSLIGTLLHIQAKMKGGL